MNSQLSPETLAQQPLRAYQCLLQGDYYQAATLYEEAITTEPDIKSHYWYLGLALLLQQKETEAQTTWLLGMLEGQPEQVEQWNEELRQVLQTEAERREAQEDDSIAWTIRQHIREICPTDINNLLHLIGLSIKLKTYTGDELADLRVIEILQSPQQAEVDFQLLMSVLQSVLEEAFVIPSTIELAEACLPHIQEPLTYLNILIETAREIAYSHSQPRIAARLAELCLGLAPKNVEILRQLASFYQNGYQYEEGIETAKLCYSLLQELPELVFANHLVLRGLMATGGRWAEACSVFQRQESLLRSLIKEQPKQLKPITVSRLITSSFFVPYIQDNPRKYRPIQNQVLQLCQENIELYAYELVERYRQGHLQRKPLRTRTKPLKIGYLSYSLKSHSVGWLARWLFQYHNHDKFQIYAYLVTSPNRYEPLQEWYISQVHQAYKLKTSEKIAEQVYQDEIDILIDLDSITLDTSCEVAHLKPAPIQATWLGWDASGIPTVDYFIADPYVLPEKAQEYYAEKIWRLPQTYIAVDGFEVAVPTLRRDQLDIESDAVVYLSGQTGYKRNADTVRLQMKILKEVPNSYFLIKGTADQESIKNFFTQMAEEEGVNGDRLRFLPLVLSEAMHRANLGIADVVLDTYPYNGATTTLETLWMCIPLVTRVGEQFAARNSYTMMMNAGITEGIAWSDEEYIEWGVRLGKDAALRQQISWRLRQSRQTAPLWNAQQFTREMEKAYEQMWARYLEGAN
jgi:predicted O-linked N-acetylglucosamine transferase (SPINDLY family)